MLEAPVQPVSRVEKLTGRHALTALLAAAVLAFLLPFGTVSCGTPVTFTGLELATAGVPASSDEGHEFASEVESSGSAVALLGLLAAVAGLILAAAAVPGAGVAAIVGLLAVLLLPWIASYQWASYEVHEGGLSPSPRWPGRADSRWRVPVRGADVPVADLGRHGSAGSRSHSRSFSPSSCA